MESVSVSCLNFIRGEHAVTKVWQRGRHLAHWHTGSTPLGDGRSTLVHSRRRILDRNPVSGHPTNSLPLSGNIFPATQPSSSRPPDDVPRHWESGSDRGAHILGPYWIHRSPNVRVPIRNVLSVSLRLSGLRNGHAQGTPDKPRPSESQDAGSSELGLKHAYLYLNKPLKRLCYRRPKWVSRPPVTVTPQRGEMRRDEALRVRYPISHAMCLLVDI